MNLSLLQPAPGSVKDRKRIGRGTGSGRGGTSTRGHKGAKSRSGYSSKAGFEGGQMPLQRRVPKFGFKNFNKVEFSAINLDVISSLTSEQNIGTVDLEFLNRMDLYPKRIRLRFLGRGEMNSALEIHAHAFSKSAIDSIEKAGGKIVLI